MSSYNYIDEHGGALELNHNNIQAFSVEGNKKAQFNSAIYESSDTICEGPDDDCGYLETTEALLAKTSNIQQNQTVSDSNLENPNIAMVPQVEGDLIGVFDSIDADSVAKMMLSKEGGIIGVIGTDALLNGINNSNTSINPGTSKASKSPSIAPLSTIDETFNINLGSKTIDILPQNTKVITNPIVISDSKGVILGYIKMPSEVVLEENHSNIQPRKNVEGCLQNISKVNSPIRYRSMVKPGFNSNELESFQPFYRLPSETKYEVAPRSLRGHLDRSSDILIMHPLRTRNCSIPHSTAVNLFSKCIEGSGIHVIEREQINIPFINSAMPKSKQGRRKKTHLILRGPQCNISCISLKKSISAKRLRPDLNDDSVSFQLQCLSNPDEQEICSVSKDTANIPTISELEKLEDKKPLSYMIKSSFTCEHCFKNFKSSRSMDNHKKSCLNNNQIGNKISESKKIIKATTEKEGTTKMKSVIGSRCITRSQSKRSATQ